MPGENLRERVLTIVTLIAQYFIDDRELPSENDLVEELMSCGFAADEIDAAFSWMEHLSLQPPTAPETNLAVPNHRVFTPAEIRLLSEEARGFLVRLRSLGILEDALQEEIIDKALDGADDEIGLDEIKGIAALTVFARSHGAWTRDVDCVLDEDWGRLYH